jgi:hypothetical protein
MGYAVRIRFGIFAVLTLLLVPAAPAPAAFPGANGQIAVTADQECDLETLSVWRIDPVTNQFLDTFIDGANPAWSSDGTRVAASGIESGGIDYRSINGGGPQPVTTTGREPGWSPDGSQLVYVDDEVGGEIGDNELRTVNADGSGSQPVLGGRFLGSPKWSPDGTRIAFHGRLDGETDQEIYILKLSNGNVTKLTDNAVGDLDPDWSPSGSQLTYSSGASIFRMNPDGSGQTLALAAGRTPAWSPDGTRIVFARFPNIYSIAPDGSDEQLEFDGTGYCVDEPDWQPVPVITSSTHVRPVGATPFRVPLVPAAKQCTTPNRTHGPPLAFPSCNPPQPGSPNLTVGVGDGSLAFAKSEGFLRMDVIVGMPGPPDTSDVSIRLRLTNVMNLSDLSDYTGELQARLVQRLTSRNTTSGGPLVSATSVDMPFDFVVPCVATADTTLGGLCSLQTTMDAVRPGLAAEGSRTVYALGALNVYDGGPDGDADTEAGNSLLATQGIFSP